MFYNEREHQTAKEQTAYVKELYKRLDAVGKSHWHVNRFNFKGNDGKFHYTTFTDVEC